MTSQEELQMRFTKVNHQIGTRAKCTHLGSREDLTAIADLFNSVKHADLTYIQDDIQKALNNDPFYDDYSFDSVDEELLITLTLIIYGDYELEISTFKALLDEWLIFSADSD